MRIKIPHSFRQIIRLIYGMGFLFSLPANAAETQKLIIRGSDNYPPFEYINKNGQPDGFNVDMIKALMEDLEYSYDLKLESWEHIANEIDNKEIDVVIGMIYSPERSENVRFTLPTCIINRNFVTRKEDGYKSIEDLQGKDVIVQKGGWSHKYLLNSNLNANIIESDDVEESIRMISSGKYDALLTSDLVIQYTIKQLGVDNLVIGDMGISPQNYSIAVSQDRDTLLYKLNIGLQRLKLSGQYDQIYNKWFGIYEAKKTSKSFFIALGVFLFVAFLLIAFVWLLRNQVAKATRMLRDSKREVGIAIDAGKISAWTYIIKDRSIQALHGNLIGGDRNDIEVFYAMTHPDDVNQIREAFKNLSAGTKKSHDASFRIRESADSHYLYLETKMVRVEATKDYPCRIVGTFKDVTHDIQLRTKLEDYRIKSEFIINANDILLMQYDIASRCFIKINYDETESPVVVTIQEYLDMTHPDDMEAVLRFIDDLDAGEKERVHSEYRLVTKENIYNWYSVDGVAYKRDTNGKITNYIGLRRNDTAWKNITNDLISLKEKADASNRLKSAFIANMSHEIRTPLNAIVGFSELIITTEEKEERDTFMDIVRTNNDLLLKLINDILDMSRIEAGYINLVYTDFEFSVYFDELARSFKLKEHDDIRLISPLHETKIKIYLDKDRISQVITNFVNNAFKFTTAGSITLDYSYVNNGIKISVTDTGVGISEEDLSKIFERFEKINTFAQGAGLGLSICKGIIEAMEGEIGVESEVGVGSTFWCWIPCNASLGGTQPTERNLFEVIS